MDHLVRRKMREVVRRSNWHAGVALLYFDGNWIVSVTPLHWCCTGVNSAAGGDINRGNCGPSGAEKVEREVVRSSNQCTTVTLVLHCCILRKLDRLLWRKIRGGMAFNRAHWCCTGVF